MAAAPLGTLTKNAAAVLLYTIDWSAWLGTDTLATSVFSVPAGLTLVTQSNTTTKANVKISGGTAGTSYTITNTITTTTSTETELATFVLRVQ